MQNNEKSSITYYQIKKELQKKLAKREKPYLTEQNRMEYKDTLASYYSKAEHRVETITIQKLLHMPKPKAGVRYGIHIIDIAYIISLIYDDEYYQKIKEPFKNKIIKGQEATLEADELASIFLPFYETDNWVYPDKEFLNKHEKAFHRFLELQKYSPQSCLSDIRQFCTAFYNHEELPPIEKYDELIQIHKKYI